MSLLLHNRSSFFSVYIVLPGLNPLSVDPPVQAPLFRSKRLYALWLPSSDTVSLFLPLALLAAKILLPLAVDMRSRKPCLFLLFLCEGWNVLFMAILLYSSFLKQERKFSVNFFLFKDVFGSSSWLMVHSSWPEESWKGKISRSCR